MCGCKEFKILGRRLNRSQGRNPRKLIGISTTIVKCKKCDLIYSNPQPIPATLQDHYGIPPENYWKEDYFVLDPGYYCHEISRFKQLNSFYEGMKSLDIGAGIGKAMIALKGMGFDAYGFEPSEPFYKRAIEKMNIPRDRIRLGMIEEMDYPSNEFDFITFGAVLEHVYDPSASILMAMNWLKPGGLIHIEVPSSKWLVGKLINLYYKLQALDYVGNISPMHEPFHLFEFSLTSFEEHAKIHNYSVAFHEYYECPTNRITKLLVPFMRRTGTGMQIAIWLRKENSSRV